ncbi:MAG: neutral/alkaline non-lysosomal ceramidase N-terminal domain-containing protein [Bryobacterales bacterium]|nr:neutral/alkaline non-lysosomal ceramidase N-terminal domain-containing protein [Bryobacterales bacterium]
MKHGLILLLALSVCGAQDLRIGRAAVTITPPLGAPIGSSYGLTPAQGVHSDIHAKALVIESAGVRAALVACDLISIRREIVRETRKRIADTTGLSPDQVILSATHCHAGPQMHPLFYNLLPEPHRGLAERYVEALPDRIAESVRQAVADLRPARAWQASIEEHDLSFNRRFLLKDGTVRMNPGRRNPNVVRPVGPIDPQVSVVYFDTPEGNPLAAYVNFALHVAIAGGAQVSSDYPGYLSKALANVLGERLVTVFTNGMSGNINHIDVHAPEQLSGHAEAARIGTTLAADVLKALRHKKPVAGSQLRYGRVPVVLQTPSYPPAEVEQARETMKKAGLPEGRKPAFNDIVTAWRILDVADLNAYPLPTEVQVVALGKDLAWVGLPGDAFVELGLAVKLASPFAHTIVSEQSASGAISYVPNLKAFPEGSYEVISARFLPGGGETLVDSAVKLLKELK